VLSEYERLSESGQIDVFYGDESGVSLLPNVPYAWQFQDEVVTLPSERGGRMNCFALLSRDNRCFARTTEGSVTGDWIAEQIEEFSKTLERLTVIVLDNASVHARAVKINLEAWEERGLFVWLLPTYSPHLNIAEILWKKLKYEWLQVGDYRDKDTLHSAIRRLLDQVGKSLKIAFKPFNKD
jgi:transposase